MKKYFCNNCNTEITKENFAVKDYKKRIFCKSCCDLSEITAFPVNKIEWQKKEENRKKKINFYGRLWKYNLTYNEYFEMLKSQENCCAICYKPFINTPCIDHNHKNGKIRGLLCAGCNAKVGLTESVFHNDIHAYIDYYEN